MAWAAVATAFHPRRGSRIASDSDLRAEGREKRPSRVRLSIFSSPVNARYRRRDIRIAGGDEDLEPLMYIQHACVYKSREYSEREMIIIYRI